MSSSLKTIAIAALVLSSVWGCDGTAESSSDAPGPKLVEPATLLSSEEARELTGIDFPECAQRERPAVGLKLCVYEKDGYLVQVGLTQEAFIDKESGQTPESIYAAIQDAFPTSEKLDGVGDDNFLAPPGLHILAKGYYITLSLGLENKDREKLKAFGIKTVENLNRLTEKP